MGGVKSPSSFQHGGYRFEVEAGREGRSAHWKYTIRIARRDDLLLEHESPAGYPTSRVAFAEGVRHARTWINEYRQQFLGNGPSAPCSMT